VGPTRGGGGGFNRPRAARGGGDAAGRWVAAGPRTPAGPPSGAQGGEGRGGGAGWAAAGSRPKGGKREGIPLFILFLIFPFSSRFHSENAFHKSLNHKQENHGPA
jgi:hypothetical protein